VTSATHFSDLTLIIRNEANNSQLQNYFYKSRNSYDLFPTNIAFDLMTNHEHDLFITYCYVTYGNQFSPNVKYKVSSKL
jgi:hypothetical protein